MTDPDEIAPDQAAAGQAAADEQRRREQAGGAGPSRRARSALRALGLLVTAVCVWIVGDSLAGQLDQLRTSGSLPSAGALIGAGVISLGANLLLADTWRTLMRLAGQPLRRLQALWVWSVGQLARYAFGPLLIAARAAAMREEEQSGTAAAVTSVIELLLLITTSAAIVLATLPAWAPAGAAPGWLAWAGALPVAALGLVIVRPRQTMRLLARLASHDWLPAAIRQRLAPLADAASLRPGDVANLVLRHALNWALRLAAFAVILASTGAELTPLSGIVGAYAVGVFAGFLAVFAPGGLGVRELGTAALLTPLIGDEGIALATVAAVRVAEILAEVIGLAVIAVARRLRA